MDKLQNLLTNLNENKNIIRFKELELAIKNNDTLNNQYNELIKVQKKVVNNEHYNLKDSDLKTEYITKLNQLKGNPVIDEYLELIDLINEDILMITSIIEDEISNPLK
ncbi:YlbF family regulator [Candidatus Izimaplasma bacterium ZiA1]|uniref:YlbF family regulator n=1 Tax=Candidatus Izimoplasma sp. ZiA1 TaxID=2024899 RepID=UPI00143C9B52